MDADDVIGRKLRTAVVFLVVMSGLAWPGGAAAQSAIRGLSADQFDVSLTLLLDGSLDVRETMVVRFRERPASEFERELSLGRVDDLIDVRATMDGRSLEEGPNEGQVQLRRGRRSLRVTWQFPDTIDQTRTFTLEYRAMGALSAAHGRASLAWPVLPPQHQYPIAHARVEWRVPETSIRLVPTTIDDPRWTSAALSDGWTAAGDDIGPGESAMLIDAFDLATLAIAAPAWQANLDRAQQMAPAFVIGAATLIVMGVGVVGMTLFRYHQPRVDAAVVEPAEIDSLPPAVGTALVGRPGRAGLPQLRATLLDMVSRGLVTIRQDGGGDGTAVEYHIVMPRPQELLPHERVIADALWPHLKHDTIELRAGWRHVQRALPAFRRAILDELRDLGLVDRERQAAGRGLKMAGAVVTVLGAAGVAVFARVFGHLGDLPLVVPAAVVACGLVFLAAGQVMPVLSLAGVRAAVAWRGRRRILTGELARAGDGADLRPWVPVVVGLGLVDAGKAHRTNVPPWCVHLWRSAA